MLRHFTLENLRDIAAEWRTLNPSNSARTQFQKRNINTFPWVGIEYTIDFTVDVLFHCSLMDLIVKINKLLQKNPLFLQILNCMKVSITKVTFDSTQLSIFSLIRMNLLNNIHIYYIFLIRKQSDWHTFLLSELTLPAASCGFDLCYRNTFLLLQIF